MNQNVVVNEMVLAIADGDRSESVANLIPVTKTNEAVITELSPDCDDNLSHGKVAVHSDNQEQKSMQDHRRKEKCFKVLEAAVLTSAFVLIIVVFSIPTILFAIPEDDEVCMGGEGELGRQTPAPGVHADLVESLKAF